MADSSAIVEKSVRSVFVGNIPYEATEEKLRDIFSQVGPVLSFKLMYDRESGKPKGYGFCEYKDQETALSAMRNLNGYEIGGRPLRVDNACTEKSRMEMQSLMMGPVVESPYGMEVEPNKAPEAISNAVASLPPEQMYELMRQMKLCVRNNPTEARTMLMNNPQLAYALLQAQVVMRIIDPKTAVQILHGSREHVEPLIPLAGGGPQQTSVPPPSPNPTSTSVPPPVINGGPPPTNLPTRYPLPPAPGSGGYPPQGPPPGPPPNRAPAFPSGDFDMRQLGNAPRGPPQGNDQDMRQPPPIMNGPPPSSNMAGPLPPVMSGPPAATGQPPATIVAPSLSIENYGPNGPTDFDRFNRETRPSGGDFDQREPRGDPRSSFRDPPPAQAVPRETFARDPREVREREPRAYAEPPRDPRARNDRDIREQPRPVADRNTGDRDYRSSQGPSVDSRDPRARGFPQDKDFRTGSNPPAPLPATPSQALPRPLPQTSTSTNLPPSLAGQDQEKASLIMQVLQLSDEQIKMLPPEQRASIIQLKEQIQRSKI